MRRYRDKNAIPIYKEGLLAPARLRPVLLNNCAVREFTGDQKSAGRCLFWLNEGKCPRHGDVSAVQAHYRATGELTDEIRLRAAK